MRDFIIDLLLFALIVNLFGWTTALVVALIVILLND